MAYCLKPEYLGAGVRDDDEVEGGAGGVTEDAVEQAAQLIYILVAGAEDRDFVSLWHHLVMYILSRPVGSILQDSSDYNCQGYEVLPLAGHLVAVQQLAGHPLDPPGWGTGGHLQQGHSQ